MRYEVMKYILFDKKSSIGKNEYCDGKGRHL